MRINAAVFFPLTVEVEMKKIWLTAFLSIAILALPVVSSATPKPVFNSTSTASYQGACKTGNVMVTAMVNGTLLKYHFIAKNKGNSSNMTLNFTNLSSVKSVDGSIDLSSDGVWIDFAGSYVQPNINIFRGSAPASGAVLISGDGTYDPVTKTVSGTTGSIVQWDGNVDFKGVLKSGGARGMLKALIHPTNVNLITFTNTSTSESTPAVLRISLPAIQMNSK